MRGDGGFGRDSGTPKRRMLPAVTDVVRELARTVPADPAVLFKAARQAVADELAKVKQGFESAPLDVLVRRARRQLENEGVASPVLEGEREEPRSVSIPAAPRPKKAAGTAGTGGDDPFQSAAVADLDWEKRFDIQPDDAPFRSAILPLPPRSRAPQEIAPPEKTAVPAPAAPRAPSPPSSSRLPLPDRVVAPQGLSVERSGAAPRPKPPADDLPLFSSPTLELSSPVAPVPPPPDLFAPEPLEPLQPLQPEPSAPPAPEEPVAAEVRVAPIAPPLDQHPFEVPAFDAPEPPPPSLAAQEPDFERPDPWLVEPEPPAIRPPEARIEIDTPPPPSQPAPRPEPAVRSMSEMPPLSHLVGDVTEPVEPAMEEFAFKAPETPAATKKSGRNGWIAAVLVVLAVAAGLLWAVRTFLSGDVVRKVEAPLPAPKKREAAPAPAAVPAPAPAPPAAAAPATKAAAKPAVPAPQQTAFPKAKAAPLVTPDWSGKPVVYVVHFSSHKDRPSAEKEAKRLAGDLGRTARAVEVDLGPKGVWYRVVAGEFATVEDARAYRADLEAKKTPGLGFVYEMHGR